MMLEDVANQLLLPILGDIGLSDIKLSTVKEAVEAELTKGLGGGNIKLSNWIGAFLKAFVVARRANFIMFWLCKFVFGSHPHYAVKPMYFQLAIKNSVRVSLPLAPLFLGYLYVPLDIL